MSIENYYYLLINAFVISIPLLLSFDKKVHFYKRWKYYFPAMFIVAFIFIIWDIYFTKIGIWGFNATYLSGITIVNLPLEEVLFFFTIPYACTFIYDSLKMHFPKARFKYFGIIAYSFVTLAITYFTFFHYGKYYSTSTAIVAIFTAFYLLVKRPIYLNRLAFTYIISLVPFLLINGILTGSWIPDEIVWYNAQEFSGIRIGTIPFEDFFYGFSLIALNIIIYERFLLNANKSNFANY